MKKILLLGPEVTDFLNPLAKKLIEIGYTVDLLETRKIPRNNPEISKSYSSVLNYNEFADKRITAAKAIKYLFTIEFYKNLLKTVFLNYLEGNLRIIKSIRNSFAARHNEEIFSPVLNEYDLIHIHALSVGTLSFVNYINPGKKIILSYWGSDLFQIWGYDPVPTDKLKDHYLQSEPIKRADLITVMNYEMERVVIAKYGPEFEHKIVRILFGIEDKLFDLMDQFKENSPDTNFLSKYNIPENKIKITIGYCGDPICNHILILNELEKIEQITKAKIHLLVPMTYGNFTEEYMEEVTAKLNQSKISYTLFDKFLSLEELLKLRVSSNIMVQMSKSDALSASICEAIYADNLLISAVWLPYSPLRSKKIFFYETDFVQLGRTVTVAVNDFNEAKVKMVKNPERIKNLTASSKTVSQWIDIINSLS